MRDIFLLFWAGPLGRGGLFGPLRPPDLIQAGYQLASPAD